MSGGHHEKNRRRIDGADNVVTVNTGGGVDTHNLTVSATQLNVTGSGRLTATDSAHFSASQVALNGGTLSTGTGNLTLAVSGNIELTGGKISAGSQAKLTLSGTSSTLILNRTPGPSAAKVEGGMNTGTGLITVDYLARDDGGCLIDGVATLTPLMTSAASSGFFNAVAAATLGSDLIVTYPSGPVSGSRSSSSSDTSSTASSSLSAQLLASTSTTSSTSGTNITAQSLGSSSSSGSGSGDEFGGGLATGSGGAASNANTRTSPNIGICR